MRATYSPRFFFLLLPPLGVSSSFSALAATSSPRFVDVRLRFLSGLAALDADGGTMGAWACSTAGVMEAGLVAAAFLPRGLPLAAALAGAVTSGEVGREAASAAGRSRRDSALSWSLAEISTGRVEIWLASA